MRVVASLVLAAALAGTLAAQAPPVVRQLNLVAGKGDLVRFSNDVTSVSVAEPKIADVIVVTPHDVTINAKAPGHTTVFIWETGAAPLQYEVTVTPDTADADALKKSVATDLKAAIGDAAIQFSGNGEGIVLTGKAKDAAEAKRAEAAVAPFTKKVTNLIELPDPKQIQLQVKFASVDRAVLNQFGVNLISRNPNTLGATSTQQFQAPLFSQLQFQNQQLDTTNINLSNLLNLFLFRPDLNIGATVQAMQEKNLMQILAEPNLIVTEGSEASFLAGGEFAYPTIASTPTQGGIAPVTTVQFRKFGVQLDFTPTMTAAGGIHLKVRPEVSALDFNNAVTVAGVQIPALSTRHAETEVVLKDGESFAIAGLIDNRVTQVLTKVRGIGDIPIIGNLFRSRSTNKTNSELLVVITPRILQPRPANESVQLPKIDVEFLPKPKDPKQVEQDKNKAKSKDKKKASDQPQFSGAQGHELPQ